MEEEQTSSFSSVSRFKLAIRASREVCGSSPGTGLDLGEEVLVLGVLRPLEDGGPVREAARAVAPFDIADEIVGLGLEGAVFEGPTIDVGLRVVEVRATGVAIKAMVFEGSSTVFTDFPDLDHYILDHAKRSGFPKDSPFQPGDVIEVQGPAASGKTHFLYHLAGRCLLPKEINIPAKCTVHVGGWNNSVVVLDCDARWNPVRLYNILITRLNMVCGKNNASLIDIPAIAMESLSRLHIFRPQSSFQLAATLDCLPTYHMEKMPEEEFRFLFVDSISAFYWMDRWQLEPSASKLSPRPNPIRHVLHALQTIRVSHAPIIVLTNWGLHPASSDPSFSSPPGPFYKQHLGNPYPSPFDLPPGTVLPEEQLQVDIHLSLAATSREIPEVSDFHSEQTFGHKELELALRDRQKKEGTNAEEVQGYVRMPRIDCGRNPFGTFTFRILDQDVVAVN
ncbi:hypothetical protein Clacol_003874 [Clathrus columnatus]|uniref:DNA recombination and repair protein Rad51-like C-terminal domain-containing protein n=1 Tax=Clathrus columnatus TaxID=1419009 RepID=A0AAV5A9P4_9AGAM|nr:hypothetical protein Clacol_003874 [Clathrus columnatus]